MIKDRAARISQAKALLDAGHTAAAERIYAQLTISDSAHFAGFVGLARGAVQRRDWNQAADRWTAVLEKFPERVQRPWRLGHAKALSNAGRVGEARGSLDALLAANPGDTVALFLMTKLLLAGPRDQALRELSEGVFASEALFPIQLARMRVLLWLNDMPAAREAYGAGLALAHDASELRVLFEAVAKLYVGEARLQAWKAFDSRIEALIPRIASPEEDGEREALRLRVRLALRDYAAFLAQLDTARHLPDWFAGMAGQVARTLRADPFPDPMAPKIFGIGLSKTGTTSLTTALELLGYSAAHFQNQFTEAVIADEDLFLFDALIDSPIAVQFERLYAMFPNARFIYTHRPFQAWLPSFTQHFEQKHGSADFAVLRAQMEAGEAFFCGAEFAAVTDRLYLQHGDAETAYRHFETRVEQFFADKPAEKLLVHDLSAGDGWPQLCTFLGQPVPEGIAYPWENRAGGKQFGE
jgi:tetratricopeptide (TPR) repeat protein